MNMQESVLNRSPVQIGLEGSVDSEPVQEIIPEPEPERPQFSVSRVAQNLVKSLREMGYIVTRPRFSEFDRADYFRWEPDGINSLSDIEVRKPGGCKGLLFPKPILTNMGKFNLKYIGFHEYNKELGIKDGTFINNHNTSWYFELLGRDNAPEMVGMAKKLAKEHDVTVLVRLRCLSPNTKGFDVSLEETLSGDGVLYRELFS